MNAILGVGIVGLPYALSNLGYVFFGILIILVALIALYDIDLLLLLCNKLETTSYERIATLSYGNIGKIYTCVMLFLHTLFAICGFMFTVRYEMPPLIEGIIGYEKSCGSSDDDSKPWYLEGNLLVLITMLVIVLPLSTFRNIDFLGYTSGIGMLCMIVFTGIITAYKFIITCPVTNYKGADSFFNKYDEIENNPNCSVESVFEDYAVEFYDLSQNQTCQSETFVVNSNTAFAIPTLLFSFQCHASCLPIYSELAILGNFQAARKTMHKVSITAIFAVLAIYCLCSYFAYFTWYNLTMEEVLMMYTSLDASDPMIITARICTLTCVILSAPLLHFPCRKAVTKLFWSDDVEFSWIRHLSIMVVILALVTILVVFLPGIQIIFGYAGAITANSLMLILPNLFFYKMGPISKKNGERGFKHYLSLAIAIIGLVIMIGNTILLALA